MTSILGGFYISLIIWYLLRWNKSKVHHGSPSKKTSVSVVIVGRNESDNISKCLTSVWHSCQVYGPAEIIFVDDHSTDTTVARAQQLSIPILRILRLSEFEDLDSYGHAFKKAAIHYALSVATSDIILTTDADCIVSDQWMSCMSAALLQDNIALATGPISMQQTELNYLEYFQEIEMMGTMAGTKAGIESGLYFSANAANMVYYRGDYLEFCAESKNHLASGDDMFFVQWLAMKSKQIAFVKMKNAIVKTNALCDFKDFINQRIRWATKTKSYELIGIKVLMALVFFFHSNIVISLLLAIITSSKLFLWLALSSILAKLMVDYLFLSKVSEFFDINIKKTRFPWLVCLHMTYVILIGIAGLFFKTYQWKGRRVS